MVPDDEMPAINPAPAVVIDCKASGMLKTSCNAGTEIITDLEVDETGHLAEGILESHLSNRGQVSNLTITPAGSVTGGKVSGYTKNEGLIEDVKFVGASITGKNADGEIAGTLGGKVRLASQIGGVVEDVNLAPDTQIVGSGIPAIGSEKNRDIRNGHEINSLFEINNLVL